MFYIYYSTAFSFCLWKIVSFFYKIVILIMNIKISLDLFIPTCYTIIMEFQLKTLTEQLTVNRIANIHFFEFSENFTTKDDSHPFYEFVFVKKGSLEISSASYSGRLNKGEMILHTPNELHSLTCPADSAPIVVIIGFESDTDALAPFSLQPKKLNKTQIDRLAEIIKIGRSIFAPPYNISTYNMKKKKNIPFGNEQLLKIFLETFLIELVKESQQRKPQTGTPLSHTSDIKEVISYLDDNYLEKILIDELVFIFNSNRSKLCREFKAKTGVTILEYINRKKLSHAKRLLEESNETITSIATKMNFDTIHYFTTFFKQQTGISPKEYRAISQNSP